LSFRFVDLGACSLAHISWHCAQGLQLLGDLTFLTEQTNTNRFEIFNGRATQDFSFGSLNQRLEILL
jgi:hypothetical protein